MKLFYYYLRNRLFDDHGKEIVRNNPYGCVCIGCDENKIWSRGISLCSPSENFVKKEGRKQARGRCLRAMFTFANSEKINYNSANVHANRPQICWLDAYSHSIAPWKFTYKSQHNVNLTDYEFNIIRDEKL